MTPHQDQKKNPVQGGKENRFVFAWGGLMTAYAQQRIVLWVLALGLIASTIGNVVLAMAYTKRETWVFVKDHLGNVIQADPNSFLRAGDDRSENEIKGFALRFCRDAFEFTPLDVQDRLKYALRFVEPKAHGAAKNSLRLAERAKQVENGLSVKIEDDIERGKIPEVSIIRNEPCEVLAVFSRVSIAPDGTKTALPPLAVRLIVTMVPRSPNNPSGLLITDVTATNS